MKHFFLFFLFIPFSLFCQSFKLVYSNFSPLLEISNTYEFETNKYTIIAVDSDEEYYRTSQILEIDYQGEVKKISPLIAKKSVSIYLKDLHKYQEQWILQGTYNDDNTDERGIFYYKTNSLNNLNFDSFNKIALREDDLNYVRHANSIVKDSILHIIGYIDTLSTPPLRNPRVFGLRLNIKNNEILKYNPYIITGYTYGFLIDKDNNYINQDFGIQVKIDSNFNYVSEYLYYDVGVYNASTVKKWDDSTYLVSGTLLDVNTTNIRSNIGVSFANKDFVVSTKYYRLYNKDTLSFAANYRSSDWYDKNNIFLGGNFNYQQAPLFLTEPKRTTWAIANLDNKLKQKWLKYFPSNYYDVMQSILACSDKGVLAAGIRYDFDKQSSSIYILKLDQQGLVKTDDPQFNADIKVFPNPAKEVVNVSSSILDSKLTVYLYDMLGRLITSKTFTNFTTLDVANFNPGIYNYTIKDANKKIIQTNKIILK